MQLTGWSWDPCRSGMLPGERMGLHLLNFPSELLKQLVVMFPFTALLPATRCGIFGVRMGRHPRESILAEMALTSGQTQADLSSEIKARLWHLPLIPPTSFLPGRFWRTELHFYLCFFPSLVEIDLRSAFHFFTNDRKNLKLTACWFLTCVTTCLSLQSNLGGKDTLPTEVCTFDGYLGDLEGLLLK